MKKYALLISGGFDDGNNHGRYLNDLTEIYKTLLEKYGYLKSDITVLYANGSAHDLDGDGSSEITNSAIKADVIKAFQDLKAKVTANDLLFIYSTNHGGQSTAGTNNARLWLWNREYIEDGEFATLLDALSYKLAIITMEQCYSGGFVDNLQGPNRVIATACNWDEVSWACDSEGNFDEFVYHWTAAVRGKKPDGTPVDAAGPDGNVSLKEGFDYAKANDSTNEKPQYYENPTGIGDQYTLGGPIVEVAKPKCGTIFRDLEICRPIYRDIGICRPIYKDLCYRDICRSRDLGCIRDICFRPREFCVREFYAPTRETEPIRGNVAEEANCIRPRDITICRRSSELVTPVCSKYMIGPIVTGPCFDMYCYDIACYDIYKGKIDPRVIDPRVDPGSVIIWKYVETRDACIAGIQSLSNAGYTDEDIANSLEDLAKEMQTNIGEIAEMVNEIRSKGGQHFNRMTRR